VVEAEAGGAQQGQAGVGLQVVDLALEAGGVAEVVGVEPGDVGGAGQGQGNVEGRGEAEITGIGVQAQARIADGLEESAGAVGGGVVDDDELEVGQGLGKDAGDGVENVGPLVVGGDDDGDDGLSHRRPPVTGRTAS
jgi:hypothetical protein